jgi:amphi-Trp domain-containing protein
MAIDRIKKHFTRTEAADQLAQLAQQLRDGRVSLGRKAKRLPASDEVELLAELEEDSLRVELRWET